MSKDRVFRINTGRKDSMNRPIYSWNDNTNPNKTSQYFIREDNIKNDFQQEEHTITKEDVVDSFPGKLKELQEYAHNIDNKDNDFSVNTTITNITTNNNMMKFKNIRKYNNYLDNSDSGQEIFDYHSGKIFIHFGKKEYDKAESELNTMRNRLISNVNDTDDTRNLSYNSEYQNHMKEKTQELLDNQDLNNYDNSIIEGELKINDLIKDSERLSTLYNDDNQKYAEEQSRILFRQYLNNDKEKYDSTLKDLQEGLVNYQKVQKDNTNTTTNNSSNNIFNKIINIFK